MLILMWLIAVSRHPFCRLLAIGMSMWSRCNSRLLVLASTLQALMACLRPHRQTAMSVKWYWTPRILFPCSLIATSQPNYSDGLNLLSSALSTPRTLLSILVAILAPLKKSPHFAADCLLIMSFAFSPFSLTSFLPHPIYSRFVNTCRVRDWCAISRQR